jgi:DNA-binding MarR family transcriptional regulator
MPTPAMLTSTQLLTLAALMRCPMHCYAARQEIIIKFTGNRASNLPRNNVRRALKKLLQAGYVQECNDPHYWVTRQRGNVYELTDRGRHRLERELLIYYDVVSLSRHYFRQHDVEQDERRRLKDSFWEDFS